MWIEIDGVKQPSVGSSQEIRQVLSNFDPNSDAILRVTNGRDNLDIIRLADGFHLTGNNPADRQSVFNSSHALMLDEAVEAVVAYQHSGRASSAQMGVSPVREQASRGPQAKLAMLLAGSVVACAAGLGLLSRDVPGQVSTPTYVAGIAALVLWAGFSFLLLSSGMRMTRQWLARTLDVRIEQKISVVDSSWQVLDEGRWAAKFVVGFVPLLIALVPLLGALIGGSLFFIVG